MSIISGTRFKPTEKEKRYISERTISPFGVPNDFKTIIEKCRNRNQTLEEENNLESYAKTVINKDYYENAVITKNNTENVKINIS